MSEPVFSIITPTCNRNELLKRNIQSLVGQSYTNYEHIIIDDSGCGNAEKIVSEFNDSRIIYLKHDNCRGAAAAYNSGIRMMRGRYVSFLDDDDEYMSEYLSKVLEFFNEDLKETDFIWTGILKVKDTEEGEIILKEIAWSHPFRSIENSLIEATSIGNGYGLCVKRDCIDEVGLFDENLKMSSDTDYLFRLAQKFNFRVISKSLVKIHQHQNFQLTDAENDYERIRCYEKILERNNEFLNKYPDLLSMHYNSVARICYRSGDKVKGRALLREILIRNPFRMKTYPDFFTYELWGKNFTATRVGGVLNRILG